ncbi:MAG: flagellar export protein FliJ [Deltaproteobacteria bacterium]|nr:flagellar export protein FliJ [Deltaproteobacteria bacterium]
MAGFHFRLGSVLRYRERMREEKKLELYRLDAEKRRLARHIAELEQTIAGHRKMMEEQAGKWLSISELRSQGDFIQCVTEAIIEQSRLKASLDGQLVEKRAEVVGADIKVKSLERLRSRLLQKYRFAESKDEQKLTDEMARQRYTRRDEPR